MSNRVIKSYTGQEANQLRRLLESLFALELLSPSPELYLYSPWISNIGLLDNRSGRFRSIIPFAEEIMYKVSDVLELLAKKGSRIRIIARPNDSRTEAPIGLLDHENIEVKRSPNFHEKSITCNNFFFRGSMNLTYFGTHINDEHIEVADDAVVIAKALLEAKERWESY